MFGKIKVTDFGKRQFEGKSSGTKITDFTFEEFENTLNSFVEFFVNPKDNVADMPINVFQFIQDGRWGNARIIDGYAPFCKLIAIPNFTNARVGSMPIDMANYQYLRHGYSSRTPAELPVMSRWFELPIQAPVANYLLVVVYSREQLEKEFNAEVEKNPSDNPCKDIFMFDAEWGVVAILGQTHPNEEPMAPITMMRNALGVSEGGSGVAIDRDKYLASVEFWKNNAIVKS